MVLQLGSSDVVYIWGESWIFAHALSAGSCFFNRKYIGWLSNNYNGNCDQISSSLYAVR